MDAGARGRRLLQRREYKAKVSDFIPKELEDQFSHDKNGQLVFELDLKKVGSKLKQGLKNFINKPIMKPNITKDQHLQKIRNSGGDPSHWANSFEPEGEMIEANSAQMKAMQDAKVKKMEDDKVAAKKKKVEEENLKEYSPNVSYQAKGGKKSGKLSKSSVYSLRGKKESKKDFRKSHTKDIKDGLVEDMKGMSQKSGDKRSTESGAGMTAKGVAKYNSRTGGNLKTAVTTPPSKLKAGSKAANRRKSFCARSKSWDGPRGKAARRRWNCSFEPELPMIIDEKKKLFNSTPLSDRVASWSKKISEGMTPGRNDYGLPTGLKSNSGKKNIEKKVNPKNLPIATASYEPQGELIEMGKKGKGAINPDVLKGNPNLDPLKPGDYIKLKRLSAKVNKINERKMTSAEKDKKEKYVKGMKKDKGGFTKRYGKDGKSVMYATATKMAMKNEGVFTTGAAMTAAGLATWKLLQGLNTRNQMKKSIETPGTNLNKIKSANDQKNMLLKQLQQNSFKPEGQMTEQSCGKGEYYCNDEQKCKPIPKGMKVGKGGMLAKEDFYRKKYTVKDGYKKTNKMTKSNKRAGDSKAQNRELHIDLAKYKVKKLKTEGSLHKWFKGSKSKDGKGGWVNVVTGGTCASDKPGEGTPKCVSSSKRASMSKAERLSASRRKKKADPGQQSKSGAAKPTYVATDSKKKK